MENSFMKNSLKKLEFPNQTPARTKEHHASDFYSSQKGKYDNLHKTTNQSMQIVLKTEDYNNQKEFYDNQVPIRMKSNEREDFQTYLNIKISMITPSPHHSQVLHFELTDETNHLFLYVLDISETDFLTLKNELNILVDFQAFPARLVELLELVMGSAGRDEKVHFQCIFDIKSNGEASFNVVENNQFQALVHLSLKFREATDHILKNHLAHRLSNEKSQNEDLRIRLERLDEKYSSKTDDLERAQNELRRFQDEKEKQVNDLLNEEKRKINELNDQAIKKEIQITRAAEADRKEIVANYERSIRDLQHKNETLTKANQDLMEAKIQLEGTERELLSKIRSYEKETNILQKDLDSIRGNNKELDSVRFSHEKALAEYRIRVESLEGAIRSKEELLAKQSDLLDNTTKQKAYVEENLLEAKKKMEKLEQKINLCSEEINKGNEIIEKLQAEAAQQKQKLKAKNTLVIQQEETIVKHQENSDRYYKQTLDLQREINNKDFAIKELDTQLEDLKSKLTESQKTIESNVNMINWLNKCLNENQRPTGVRLPFTNKFQGGPTTSNPSHSPYKAYSDADVGGLGGNSMKYSTSINVDKYKPMASNNLDAGFSGTSTNPLSFSKTLGTFGGTMSKDQYNTADFDKESFNKVSTLQGLYDGTKENVDFTNRSMASNNALTSHKNPHNVTGNEFTSTSSIDISTYNRNIQPIKYQDPHK